MRVGNNSWATPFRFFTKLTEAEVIKLFTRAMLQEKITSTKYTTSFTVWLPTWYSKKPTGEKPCDLVVNGKRIEIIYLDTNDYSAKPGVLAEWMIRITD